MQVRTSALALIVSSVVALAAPGAVVDARAAGERPTSEQVERAAHALEDRLVAPCCWRETLRSHASPVADQLRAEVRERLGNGEAPSAVEADLVRRYGPRIRAFSAGWDPRRTIGVVGGVLLVGALGGVVWSMRRRRVRAGAPVSAPATPGSVEAPAERERLADVLDDELARADP